MTIARSNADATAPQDAAYRSGLLRLIAIGGSAVLASYLLALDPAVGGRLWGGLPEGAIRALYTVNMLLAAVGFFPATWWLVHATPASTLRARTGFGVETLFIVYAVILMASSLWLPLTALHLRSPSPLLWIAIRAVLLGVGAGASLLALLLIRLARHGTTSTRLAVVAFFFFWLQTMVLDALVWPHYYSTGD